MTLKQTERLLQLLAHHGVFHYKTTEIEISRDASGGLQPISPKSPIEPLSRNTLQEEQVTHPPAPLGDITPSSINIPHEVNKVASLLKLDDYSLVDALFPEQPPSED